MPEKTFSEDDETLEESGSGAAAEVEYAFAGFNIEFSEKIVLTPAGDTQNRRAKE